jgi:hypothetical protein
MNLDNCEQPPKGNRTDVGYKRPPPETRFRKGQKPPPRKKKVVTPFSARDLFWKVLQEGIVRLNRIIFECAQLGL